MTRLKLVPWERTWMDHRTLDLHAVYERPTRDPLTWEVGRDEDGCVVYDLVGPMSIRNHSKYLQKGFRYVTLGRAEDVIAAADPSISERGAVPLGQGDRDPNERADDYLRQGAGVRGPWDATAYLADMADAKAERLARIEEHVLAYGPDGAEAFERQTDPGYVLPDRYRTVPASEDAAAPKRKRGRPRKVESQPTETVPA